MAPIRILILAVLIYIGYRLLRNSFSTKEGPDPSEKSAPGPSDQLTDVLVEDPVCGTLVPREQAVKLEHDGETFYFCSQKCCDEFISQKGDNQ